MSTNDKAPIPDLKLDVRGLLCPMPLLKAKKSLNSMNSGEILEVLATDPASQRDFEVFSRQSGHRLLASQDEDGVYRHWLLRA